VAIALTLGCASRSSRSGLNHCTANEIRGTIRHVSGAQMPETTTSNTSCRAAAAGANSASASARAARLTIALY
jgi:hypothetical protein